MNDMTRSTLDEIRQKIDDLDRGMHRDLMRRSGVIEDLIKVKAIHSKYGDQSAAFRPAREAEIARRLALHHAGGLPLATVEHLWREIISSFTNMQSPFSLALAPGAGAADMRDLARFYFGFSVPIVSFPSATEAVSHLRSTPSDLAIIEIKSPETWWDALPDDGSVTVLARIPFMETPDRASMEPAYVVGPKTPDYEQLDILVCLAETGSGLAEALAPVDGRIVQETGALSLIEIPAITGLSGLESIMTNLGLAAPSIVQIGAVAAPIRLLANGGVNREGLA